jgi:hypothetical protein
MSWAPFVTGRGYPPQAVAAGRAPLRGRDRSPCFRRSLASSCQDGFAQASPVAFADPCAETAAAARRSFPPAPHRSVQTMQRRGRAIHKPVRRAARAGPKPHRGSDRSGGVTFQVQNVDHHPGLASLSGNISGPYLTERPNPTPRHKRQRRGVMRVAGGHPLDRSILGYWSWPIAPIGFSARGEGWGQRRFRPWGVNRASRSVSRETAYPAATVPIAAPDFCRASRRR